VGRLDGLEPGGNFAKGLIPGDALKIKGAFRTLPFQGMAETVFGINDFRGVHPELAGDAEGRAVIGPHCGKVAFLVVSDDDPAPGRADAAQGSLLFSRIHAVNGPQVLLIRYRCACLGVEATSRRDQKFSGTALEEALDR
jgi:hypothetical protein